MKRAACSGLSLISGICGFVGSTLARRLVEAGRGYEVSGFDNFIRPGSETNRAELKRLGVKLFHGDLRVASDLETLPAVDWVIDAAAKDYAAANAGWPKRTEKCDGAS